MAMGSSTAIAQALISPVPTARALEVVDGLVLGEVYSINQTRDGLLWFGTDEGLIRYDGYNAKRFSHSPADSKSLSFNKVTGIVEDEQGFLWLSTYGGGLNKFDKYAQEFTKIDLSQAFYPPGDSNHLRGLTLDSQQTLWIYGDSGFAMLDAQSGKAKERPFNPIALNERSILKVFADQQNHIWFATKHNGIYYFNGKALKHFNQQAGLASNHIHEISQDKNGVIWLGTAAGLHRFDAQTQRFESKLPSFDSSFNIPDSEITSLKEDHLGRLWLGTENSGVHLYDPAKDQFIPLTSEADPLQNFKAEKINQIFADREQSLWLTTDDGVLMVTKAALDIRYLTNKEMDLAVSDVVQLRSGQLAFTGNYQYYDYDPKSHQASGRFANENRLYRITESEQGNLLFATLDQGLQLYSKHDDQLYQIPHAKPLYSDIPITGLFDSFIDNQERTWLLPFPDLPQLAGGIIQFDWKTYQYQTYLSSPFISDVVQFDDNQLMLSSDSAGLISLDIDSKLATRWQHTIPSTPRRILTLFKDSKGILWVGTRGQGLAKFEANTEAFHFYGSQDGFISNDIYSIVEDKNHKLWLGSDKGLIRFDPNSGKVLNLQQSDGLLFTSFYKRAATNTTQGQLLFGSQTGLVSINPDDFDLEPLSPEVIISDFKLFNQSVDWREPGEDPLLSKPIQYTESLQLTHAHRMFSFEFATTEYIKPEAIRFAYMMEGLNGNWIYTDAKQRVAGYSTLPQGDYVLRVKATNRHGQWSDKETTINISVLPPWWLSWPAYIAYAITLTLGILLFINLRTKKLVQRANELEDSVAQRTAELQHSRDQVTELLAQKQQLFASVSHEFRTPLTLILSPIDQLLKDPKGQHITKELGLIKRNGRRLLRMVDQLLEFAKLELKDDTQMEHVSLKQTLEIIVSSFEPLVKTKQIKLHVAPYEDVTLNMLPDSLNKILINILSNAYKYSPPQSDIYVSVEQQGESVTIAIRDTGIGISEADIDMVFQRFNRATQTHGEAIPGAGIGLALVKELVEANFGHINLQSELNQGSTFSITLPIVEAGLLSITAEPLTAEVLHEHLDLEIDSVNTAQTAPPSQTVEELDEGLKSILIVDDNPDLRDLLYQQLSGKYQCLLAENGQVGLESAQQHLPDLVISDVMMPVMDGYQLTERLKKDELTSHIPVILLTAKGSTESRLKGLQLLVDDYLAKPFNMEELTLRIHNILTIRDIIKQKFRQVIDQTDPSAEMNKLSISDPEQAFVKRVNEQLSNFYTDPDFTAKVLSRELGVSERQLQRKLKSQFDLGFPEMVRNFRLNKAVEMLSSGQRVSQIYHLVGFSSHSYFSSCFKAKFGRTPKEYQQDDAN